MEKNLKPLVVNNKLDPEGCRVQTVVVHKEVPEGGDRPAYTLELGTDMPENWREYLNKSTLEDWCVRRVEPSIVTFASSHPIETLQLDLYWHANRGVPLDPSLVEPMMNYWPTEVFHLGIRREGSPKIIVIFRGNGFFRFYRYNRCNPLDEPEFSPPVQITREEYNKLKETLAST